MANVVTLHKRQLFLADGTVAKFAEVSFRLNHTSTQLSVFSDPSCAPEFERSQPVICDVYGVLPVCYMVPSTGYRMLATDENLVSLPGFPMDDITPEPTDTSGADTVSFTPSTLVPQTTVQAAIDYIAGLTATPGPEQVTVWTTGGSGNTYTLTPTPALVGYSAGTSYWIRPDRANTGAVTLNVSGLGTRSVQKTSLLGTPVALAAGELQPYREVLIADDGSVFRVLARRSDDLSGSDANGTWDRFSNGLMICSGSLTLPFLSPAHCGGVWTYPGGPFLGTPADVTCTIVGGPTATDSGINAASGTAVPIFELGPPIIGPRLATSMTCRVYHNGAADFAPGNVLYAVVNAKGRWK